MNATWRGVTFPFPKLSAFLALDLFPISSKKIKKQVGFFGSRELRAVEVFRSEWVREKNVKVYGKRERKKRRGWGKERRGSYLKFLEENKMCGSWVMSNEDVLAVIWNSLELGFPSLQEIYCVWESRDSRKFYNQITLLFMASV